MILQYITINNTLKLTNRYQKNHKLQKHIKCKRKGRIFFICAEKTVFKGSTVGLSKLVFCLYKGRRYVACF